MFFVRYLGWFVAAVLAASWYFVPQAAVWLLDGNLWLLTKVGSGVAMIVPHQWGGGLLADLTALVQSLAGVVKTLASSSPSTEAALKIILESLLILGEVKVVRAILFVPRGLRRVGRLFRRPAKVVPFRPSRSA